MTFPVSVSLFLFMETDEQLALCFVWLVCFGLFVGFFLRDAFFLNLRKLKYTWILAMHMV